MNEQTLIQKCIEGNAKAQKALFDKFAPKMMTVCLRYVSNRMEADDVIQDGFIKLFHNLPNYRFEGSFDGWVRRIFVNTALDHIKRNKNSLFEVSVDEIQINVSSEYSPSAALQENDLLKMVQNLPTGYRTVFNLYAIEGYSHKEIGEMLQISENTSKSQYSRAKLFLQSQLEKIKFER